MKKFHASALFLIIICLVCTQSIAGEAEKEALKAAEEWLILIDNNDYSASWDNAAALFKQAITKEQWAESFKAIRPAMGDIISRNLKSATYTDSLPGAPDGEYVVIQFSSRFTNKKSAIETVTPMKDPDGKWRVSGYYIR
ncbi:MAG: DUF4019 domain-containing protein [Deltaproteobacteria bacterium]